jgi:signal transduction histidine kinase
MTRQWKTKLQGLTVQIEELSSDLHRISHELHPAKLEQLGLEASLRSICREMATAHRIKIDFQASNIPRDLTSDVCLCAYRITQEALQNIAKHSGASNVNVRLLFERSALILTVSDNGTGFVTDLEKDRESLGLVSMNERLEAMNGKLKVESEPGAGTKITAKIPYP